MASAEVGARRRSAGRPGRLESVLESLLFASDRPLTVAELKRLVGERDGGKLTRGAGGAARPPRQEAAASR